MGCCNKSRKSYLGLKSVFSRVRRKTSSLQPYICILLKSGLIPGISQRCTSPSFSATHWQGLGWILVCRPCLYHPWLLMKDPLSLKHQTPTDIVLLILHNTSHQAAFQTTPAFTALQVQCTSPTKLYYSLSTRALNLQTPTSKYNRRWRDRKSVV